MMDPAPSGMLEIRSASLEYRMIGPHPREAPTLVLLHEGLGSVAQWGSFPDDLARETNTGVFVYSRRGYGASSPRPLPWPASYMHEEAREILPGVLDAIGFRRGLLVGHSDGASIATIYAGSVQDHRIRGLSLIAPHFVVEDVSIASIEAAKRAYDAGNLRAKLQRHHRDVEVAFRGWSEAWLDPAFRAWDITEELAYIRVPVQVVQGAADEYGTLRQVEIAQEECYCPVEVTILPDVGHAPHREAAAATLAAVAGFANRILKDHGEGDLRRAA